MKNQDSVGNSQPSKQGSVSGAKAGHSCQLAVSQEGEEATRAHAGRHSGNEGKVGGWNDDRGDGEVDHPGVAVHGDQEGHDDEPNAQQPVACAQRPCQ